MWRHLFLTLPLTVIIVALVLPLFTTPLSRILPQQLKNIPPLFTKSLSTAFRPPTANMTRPPVYFFSHGGVRTFPSHIPHLPSN